MERSTENHYKLRHVTWGTSRLWAARDSLIWKSDLPTNNATQQYTKPVGDAEQSVLIQSSMALVPGGSGSGPSRLLMGLEPMFPESDSQSHLVINKGSLLIDRLMEGCTYSVGTARLCSWATGHPGPGTLFLLYLAWVGYIPCSATCCSPLRMASIYSTHSNLHPLNTHAHTYT